MGAGTFVRAAGTTAGNNKDLAEGVLDTKRVVRGVYTFSASYANPAGDTIPMTGASSVGLQQIDKVLIDPELQATGADPGLSIRLGGTPGARTLRAFDTTNTEIANATNLGTRAIGVWFIGY